MGSDQITKTTIQMGVKKRKKNCKANDFLMKQQDQDNTPKE